MRKDVEKQMEKLIKYPLGQQDFKTLRNLGYL